jgi:hypothetical protein
MTRRFSPSTSLGNVLISSTRELYALHVGCARGLYVFYCLFWTVGLTPADTDGDGASYTARVGCTRSGSCGASAVRFGARQSIPSRSIDNCAALKDTAPLSARGHTKRPALNRL